MVAFTLGFVSHQVADVTWHSLGIEQGFLTTMGDVNFFGSFPDAHSVGDPGGDMVVSFEGDTRKIPSGINEWYVNCVVVGDELRGLLPILSSFLQSLGFLAVAILLEW